MSDRLLPSGQWLKDRLSTCWVGKSEIIYEEEIPSTNTLLKELARQGAPAGGLRLSKCRARAASASLESGCGRNAARIAAAQAPSYAGADSPLHAGGGSCGFAGHRTGLSRPESGHQVAQRRGHQRAEVRGHSL